VHHHWKDRFKTALHNKNWKKVVIHEILELAWLGSWVTSLEGSLEGWIIGISGAVIIHFVVFEAIDALHKKSR
jgi:hypothetical protein